MALSGADATRTFIQAFNDQDLDALVAVLDPEVEIQASRGVVIGHHEVRRWARRCQPEPAQVLGDIHGQP